MLSSTGLMICSLRFHQLQILPHCNISTDWQGGQEVEVWKGSWPIWCCCWKHLVIKALKSLGFSSDVIPSEWEESFILKLYKVKCDTMYRNSYRGLKLTDQVMKLLEYVLDCYIRPMVNIDKMQYGFMPGRGTTDTIVHQLQEKFITAVKTLLCLWRSGEGTWSYSKKVIW